MQVTLPIRLPASVKNVLFTTSAALLLFVASSSAQVVRQINNAGTTQPVATQTGAPGIQDQEIDTALAGNDSDDDLGVDIQGNVSGKTQINRSIAPGPGQGPQVPGKGKAKSNPEIVTSFDGLNFFQQRFANNGNQFSVEPPDQALCAGNGFVLESVNDVLNVYGPDGSTLLGVTDLNTFYGYPAAIDRTKSPLQFGPSITDPTCHFDPASQRWFHVVLTLDRASPTTQSLNGKNHLDIAVSNTSSPLGTWTVFHLPVQDDGTNGTPDHNCHARVSGVLIHGPCLGDYPHIGMDANGLYITTNEFDLFTPGRFHGAQIYAISKQGLISGGPANVVQFDTTALAPMLPFGIQGFTVFPAISPGTDFRTDNGGTEFLLSSLAVFSNTGAFDELVTWQLTNTQSLNGASPAVNLTTGTVNTQTYAVPSSSFQKAGPFPLGQCLADSTIPVGTQLGCWRFFFASGGPFTNPDTRPPSNDSRMQQVSYANGKLWAALDTAATVNGKNQAGIAFFVLHPSGPSASVITQGVIALANNNVTYPAVGVNSSGRGVIAFTVLGADHFPSAGYAALDAKVGAGDVHIAAEGAARQDGFSGYFPEVNPIRPRWGDYGAAAVDGNTIWFASEYIANSCDLTTYVATNFTCGNTRGSLGNWATRITHVTVQ
ncbi:MAG: hypothetical protein ACXV8M_12380 [Candidatus Angelobacter sp.]